MSTAPKDRNATDKYTVRDGKFEQHETCHGGKPRESVAPTHMPLFFYPEHAVGVMRTPHYSQSLAHMHGIRILENPDPLLHKQSFHSVISKRSRVKTLRAIRSIKRRADRNLPRTSRVDKLG